MFKSAISIHTCLRTHDIIALSTNHFNKYNYKEMYPYQWLYNVTSSLMDMWLPGYDRCSGCQCPRCVVLWCSVTLDKTLVQITELSIFYWLSHPYWFLMTSTISLSRCASLLVLTLLVNCLPTNIQDSYQKKIVRTQNEYLHIPAITIYQKKVHNLSFHHHNIQSLKFHKHIENLKWTILTKSF